MTGPDSSRFVARVVGRVQGVGYRYFVRSRAGELRLGGSVQNLPNGSVRVEAEGPRAVLLGFLSELHVGPPAAVVERVDVEWHPPLGNSSFAILAG
jgi:acylphosphatase